jgi:hypothetical protein
MKPIGCIDMSVPPKAPTRATRPLRMGMALAMIYPRIAFPAVQEIQTAQWVGVFWLKCREPRIKRRKRYFAVNCN